MIKLGENGKRFYWSNREGVKFRGHGFGKLRGQASIKEVSESESDTSMLTPLADKYCDSLTHQKRETSEQERQITAFFF